MILFTIKNGNCGKVSRAIKTASQWRVLPFECRRRDHAAIFILTFFVNRDIASFDADEVEGLIWFSLSLCKLNNKFIADLEYFTDTLVCGPHRRCLLASKGGKHTSTAGGCVALAVDRFGLL